jgi:hypothetical protein
MHPAIKRKELLAKLDDAIARKAHKEAADIAMELFELIMKQLGYSDEVIEWHKKDVFRVSA